MTGSDASGILGAWIRAEWSPGLSPEVGRGVPFRQVRSPIPPRTVGSTKCLVCLPLKGT